MLEKLRALVQLAEIDASARGLDERILGIPTELEERRQAMQSLEALLAGQRAELEEAEALLEQQERELKARGEMLVRAKAKGAKARNMREADAADRELESVRRSMRDGEAERERLQGVIERTRSVLAEPLEELRSQREALEEAEASMEATLAELRAKRDEVTRGREVFAARLPKRVVRRYERIRPKIHPAVVPALEGVCQGCRMALPPQLYNDLQKVDEFHNCPQCNRFVYYPEALQEDGAEPDAGPVP